MKLRNILSSLLVAAIVGLLASIRIESGLAAIAYLIMWIGLYFKK